MTKRSAKILRGVDEITSYLGISRPGFYKLVKAGLWVRKDDGGWVAHADNLDNWMAVYTKVHCKNIPDEELFAEGV